MNLLVRYVELKYIKKKQNYHKIYNQSKFKILPSDYKLKYYFVQENEQDSNTFILKINQL